MNTEAVISPSCLSVSARVTHRPKCKERARKTVREREIERSRITDGGEGRGEQI